MNKTTRETKANANSKKTLISISVSIFLALIMIISGAVMVFSNSNKYTITYFSNIGDAPMSRKAGMLNADTLRPMTYQGYTFVGWYKDSDFTKIAYNSELSGDITLYAKWVPVDNTFNPKDGETTVVKNDEQVVNNVTPKISTSSETLQTAVKELASVDKLEDVIGLSNIKDTYTWSDNAKLYTAFDISVDVEDLKSCKITMDIDDQTVGNDLIVLHYNSKIGEWEICSYERADNKITISFPNGLSPVAFYLNGVQTYTITYYVNGEVYLTKHYLEGATITPVDEPTLENSIFDKWCTTNQLTSEFIETVMPTHAISLYAKFISEEELPYNDYSQIFLNKHFNSTTSLYENVFKNGEGTEASPFMIGSAYELDALAKLINNGAKYASDKAFGSAIYAISNDIDASNGEFTTSIGTATNNFSGKILGNAHKIKYLTGSASLFGTITNATITELELLNCNLTISTTKDTSVGALVGYAIDSTISYCFTSGRLEVIGSGAVGGIVGEVKTSTLKNCVNRTNVTNNGCVGGVVGKSSNSTLKNISNQAEIIGTTYVGGLVARLLNQSNLYTSFNTGYVTGTSYVGGLVGEGAGTILNSYNTGKVNFNGTTTSFVAGICAYNSGTIKNVYSFGDIEGVNANVDMNLNPLCNGNVPLNAYYNLTAFKSGTTRTYYLKANTPSSEQSPIYTNTGKMIYDDTDRNTILATSQTTFINQLKQADVYDSITESDIAIWWGYDPDNIITSWNTAEMDFNGGNVSFVNLDISSQKVNYYVDDELYLSLSYKVGDTVEIISAPIKEGYTFSGWTIDGITATNFTMQDKRVDIYGTFTINSYTLTFMLEGNKLSEFTGQYQTNIVFPKTEKRVGYIFAGWFTDSTFENKFTDTKVPNEDTTLFGKYELNRHSIKYYIDGTIFATDHYFYNEAVTVRENPTREGSTFSGWKLENKQDVPTTMPDSDLVVVGSFEVNSYSINFYVDGVLQATTEFKYNYPINYTTPTKKGYTFDGWYSDSEFTSPYTLGAMPARNLDLYSRFNINTYTITYYVDGVLFRTDPYLYDTEITLPTLDIPVGHHFSGWDIMIPTNMPDENLETHGFILENAWTVTYVANGGKLFVESQTVIYGKTITQPADPTKFGYSFSGWYSDEELTQKFDFNTPMPDNDLILYAKWQEPISSTVSLTYEIYTDTTDGLTKYQVTGTSDSSFSGVITVVGTYGSYEVGRIKTNAFANMTGITAVVIYGVKEIQSNAFYGCSGITNVILGKGVETVGDEAFKNCVGITEVEFGESFKNLGKSSFAGCTKLSTIRWNSVEANDLPEANKPFEIDNANTTGITLTFDADVTKIPANLFNNSAKKLKISQIVFKGNNISYIGEQAFQNVIGFTTFDIPENVTVINKGTFKNASLKTITIHENITSIKAEAFSGISTLDSITLSSNLEEIGDSAFFNCIALQEIDLKNVKTLGTSSFANCRSISSITLPNTIISVGAQAFLNCFKLENIVLSQNSLFTTLKNGIFKNCPKIETITIPNNITVIEDSAFDTCSILSTITFSNVQSIGNYAFYNCKELTSISCNAVTSVGNYAFSGCEKLETTTMPNVASFGDYAFENCSSLTGLTFSSTIIKTGKYMLTNCSSITSIVVPSNITIIGAGTFKGCLKLSNISLHNAITEIGESAFSDCVELVSVDLPTNLTVISASLFSGSVKLATVEIPAQVTEIGANSFYNCSALQRVTIPNGVLKINENTFRNCSSLANVEFGSSVQVIDNSSFYNCSKLVSITLPDSLLSIESNAFRGCSSLQEVVFPDNLERIDIYAFGDCSSLLILDLPNKLTKIYSYCFSNCSSLVSVSLGSMISAIDMRAFENCTSLRKCVVPATVRTISANSFTNCPNLVVYYEGDDSISFAGFTVKYYYFDPENPETPPLDKADFNNYWRYVNGEPVAWGTGDSDHLLKYDVRIGYAPSSLYLPWITEPSLEAITFDDTNLEFVGWYYDNLFTQEAKVGDVLTKDTTLYAKIRFKTPTELTYIGYSADNTQTSVDSQISYYSVSSYNGTEKTVYIPSEYNSKPVKRIEQSAFSTANAKLNLQNVYFESSSFDVIGTSAFENCVALKLINMPYVVNEISTNSFRNCSSLETISFPTTLNVIGTGAFSFCVKLTTLRIPSTVTSIGADAFANNTKLTTISLPLSFTTSVTNNCSSLTSVTLYSGTVNEISQGLIFNKVRTLVIENVSVIKESAFLGYTNLVSVNIKGGLTLIEANAFKNCTSLATVNLPQNSKVIKESVFASCSNLVNLELGEVTEIGEKAFQNCSKLTSVKIPTGISKLGASTFEGCSLLASVEITTPLEQIGENCFKNTALNQEEFVVIYDKDNNGYLLSISANLTTITAQDLQNVILFQDKLFYGNTKLVSIALPSSLTYLTNGAFYGATSLQTFDASLSNIAEIPASTFENCTRLATIKLPNTITKIDNTSFINCGSLASFEIANDKFVVDGDIVYELENSSAKVFMYLQHSGLDSVIIPDSITVSGTDYVVSEICDNAFYGAIAIKFISANGSVKVNRNAFVGTSNINIDSITTTNDLYLIGSSLVTINGSQITLVKFMDYVHKDAVVSSSVTTIAENSFADNKVITSVELPTSVTLIETNAFNGATNLLKVKANGTVDISLTSFDNSGLYIYALTNANALGYNNVGKTGYSYKLIGFGVYELYENDSTKSATLMTLLNGSDSEITLESVSTFTTTIGKYAISSDKLTSLVVNVNSIKENAFSNCSKLTKITSNSVVSLESSKALSNTGISYLGEVDDTAKTYSLSGSFMLDNLGVAVRYLDLTNTQNLILDSSIKVLGTKSFYNAKISGIVLDNVTEIQNNAFENCLNIQTLTIPQNVVLGTHIALNTNVSYVVLSQNVSSSDSENVFESNVAVYASDDTIVWSEYNSFTLSDGTISKVAKNTKYYSETEPSQEISKYWHYVNGVPTVWTKDFTFNKVTFTAKEYMNLGNAQLYVVEIQSMNYLFVVGSGEVNGSLANLVDNYIYRIFKSENAYLDDYYSVVVDKNITTIHENILNEVYELYFGGLPTDNKLTFTDINSDELSTYYYAETKPSTSDLANNTYWHIISSTKELSLWS